MGRGIGIYGGISGGAGEPAMGLKAMRHCVGVPQGTYGCIMEPPYCSSREEILRRCGRQSSASVPPT